MRSKRTSSVSRPRCTSQASNGPGMAPDSLRQSFTAAMTAASRLATWPNSTSEWPFGALVSAATTTSAPRSSGRWPKGVMVVLSATTMAPAAWAAAATAAMSQMSRPGLDGRFDEDQAVAVEAAVEKGRRRAQVERDAERLEEAFGQHARRVVAVGRQEHAVAGLQQAEEDGRDRGHAGRKGDGSAHLRDGRASPRPRPRSGCRSGHTG